MDFSITKKVVFCFFLKKVTEIQSKDLKTKEKKTLKHHKENKEDFFKCFILTELDFSVAWATP